MTVRVLYNFMFKDASVKLMFITLLYVSPYYISVSFVVWTREWFGVAVCLIGKVGYILFIFILFLGE